MIGTDFGELIRGTDGPDTIDGAGGDDTILGLNGENYLRGGDGNDSIQGGSNFDDINGNRGNDTVDGGPGGNDWLVGGQGDDLIIAHFGDVILYGNIGSDTLFGGLGNDILRGGQDGDLIFGGAGNDWLSGDRGADTLTGGAGSDIFHSFAGAGLDLVVDFRKTEGDKILLDLGTAFVVRQVNNDTVIDMGLGSTLVLSGIGLKTLNSGRIESIAHKGLAGGGPEESRLTFDAAYAMGVRSMEMDLQITKDGQVILMHDGTVDRVTTGSGSISNMTFSQIQALEFRGAAAEKVMTLAQLVDWSNTHPDAHIYPEVKGYQRQSDIDLMTQGIKGTLLEGRTTFTSFELSDLQFLRDHGFQGELMQNVQSLPKDLEGQISSLAQVGGELAFNVLVGEIVVHPEFISMARTAGIDVAAWSVISQSVANQIVPLDIHRIVADVALTGVVDAWIADAGYPFI